MVIKRVCLFRELPKSKYQVFIYFSLLVLITHVFWSFGDFEIVKYCIYMIINSVFEIIIDLKLVRKRKDQLI